MSVPLMPKATAAWLLDHTTLTFGQIADFCGLHVLEVQALADGETFVVSVDPLATDQLTAEEIAVAQTDTSHKLRLKQEILVSERRTHGPRYTPLNRRQDKPDAVAWLLRHHGHLSDQKIIRLIGTTKNTIDKIRNRSHWNMKNLKMKSPVELGLCTEKHLEEILSEAIPNKETKIKVKEGSTSFPSKKKIVSKKEKPAQKKKSPKKVTKKVVSKKGSPSTKKSKTKKNDTPNT